MTPQPPVAHFFRHEYGRLVAMLSRRVGLQHLEETEDAVQSAFMKALDYWPAAGRPENPLAWLYRVALNELLGNLRSNRAHDAILSRNAEDISSIAVDDPECHFAGEMQDGLLRMLFVCCDPSIPGESQLVLALKILCGFSVREIALRLFISEANVYKRLGRARDRLRELSPSLDELTLKDAAARHSAVHRILYVLFTEGHLSSHADFAIRRELCDEAIRLATLLADHPIGATPELFALVALLHLHLARLSARRDDAGGLLLLEEQDRSLWDRQHIATGLEWLAKSAEGDTFSRYHAEAGIAAEHCRASIFEETRWEKVAKLYALLEHSTPSAIHRLNRAVAVAEWRGSEAGLAILDGFEPPGWLSGSYLWAAVFSDLHRRNGNGGLARTYRYQALNLAPTEAIRKLLKRRLSISN